MEISFSPKFEPLFDCLRCWDVINSDEYAEFDKDQKEYWDKIRNIDTVMCYGSRDSTKSFTISSFVPIAVVEYNHRVLFTRYIMNTTDQSISQALVDRMDMLGYSDQLHSLQLSPVIQ